MKNIKTKVMVVMLSVLMMFGAVGTLAYFATYDAKDFAKEISLVPTAEFDEGESSTEKDVVVTNTGDMDICVRVKLSWQNYDMEGNKLDRDVTVTAGDGWVKNESLSKNGYDVYEYDTVLASGDDTTKLNVKAVSKETEETAETEQTDEAYEITVIYEYTQAMYEPTAEGEYTITPFGWKNGVTVKPAAEQLPQN